MRIPILFAIVLSLIVQPADARCIGGGISILPAASSIPANAVFVVALSGSEEPLVDSFGSRYPLVLRGGGESVPCTVIETLRGSFGTSQVVVRPRRALRPGRTYRLQTLVPGVLGDRFQTQSYTVTTRNRAAAPVLSEAPVMRSGNYTMYGCGPAIQVRYSLPQPTTALWARVVLSGGASFLIPIENRESFTIGHTMCAGSFALEPGAAYTATVTLMDASGNRSGQRDVAFTAPFPKHGDAAPVLPADMLHRAESNR